MNTTKPMNDVLSPPTPCVARFSRGPENSERIDVERRGHAPSSWSLPGHRSRLPHDLCHLIVEDALAISDGFWGLVCRGVEVRIVDDHAELLYEDSPLRDQPGIDFSELQRCEEAVAILGTFGLRTEQVGVLAVVTLAADAPVPPLRPEEIERIRTLFPGRSPELIDAVRSRLVTLHRQWMTLSDTDALTFDFPSETTAAPMGVGHESGGLC
ncbi:hypothetical protein ACIRRA_45610 [Nocardia sp. NPDC101769]|uniref:hypothetical protein n=1 Tax=Nocardia sp. NPDC101769 TaxID=3364333 RepID=UPI003825DC45